MTWLDKLLGPRVFIAGTEVSPRAASWNFLTGVTAVYNAATKRLDLTVSGGGGGSGDVTGPASSVVDRLVLMAATSGKVIKQSSLLVGDLFLRNGSVSLTGNIDLGTNKATNASNATAATDLTTLQQVEALVAAGASSVADWKASVRAATTTNITLSGAQTIDGVSVIAGNRVLVKNQSTGHQNGIYVAAAGAWSRATDCDASSEVTTGLTVVVEEGTAAAGKPYILTTANPISLGATALTFTLLGSPTAGNGLTGTSTLAVLAENATIVVGASGIKRAVITGPITIADGSNVSVIGAGVVSDANLASSFVKANGSVPLTATWALGGQSLTGAKTISYTGEVNNTGATPAINFTTGDLQKITLSGNVAPTFVAPLGLGYVLVSAIGDGVQRTITWPVSVVGSPPPPAVTGRTVYPLLYDGTSYHYSSDATAYLKADGTVAMTGDLDLGGNQVTNAADALAATDLTTLQQVQSLIAAGISTIADWKQSVRAATTANITLSGAQTIDGVAVIAGNRVLVKNQSTGSQDGIYVCAAGAWSRATDCDASAEVTTGLTVVVEEGTVAAGKPYILTTANPITLGTTALTFTQLSSATAGNGLTGTSGVLSVLPEDTTITVGAGGVKRPAITGIVTIAAGSNVSAIADGAIPRAKLAPEVEYDNGISGTADTIAAANGTYQKSTLTGNCTYTLTPPASGVFEIELRLVQGGSGSYTATFTGVIWPAGGPPRLSTVVGDEDFVVLSWKGANWYGNPPPEVPDGRVAQWDDTTGTLFTSTFPSGGGKTGVDASFGLEWQGKNGVETTIAPHGDSGNVTKRRFVKFLTRPVRGTIAASASVTIMSVDCATLNGRPFVNGILKAKLHFMGQGQYTGSIEWLVTVAVNGSSIASIVGTQPGSTPSLDSGGGFSWTSSVFSASGSTFGLDVVHAAGFSTDYWAFWEIDGFEL